jgi:hypothetical protein
MPRNTSRDSGLPSTVVKRCYQRMLESDKRVHLMVDPRATVGQNLSAEQLAGLQDQRRWAKPTGRYAALLAGESVVVNAWFALPSKVYPGLRQTIPWIKAGSAVRVCSDDLIEPADARDRIAGRT